MFAQSTRITSNRTRTEGLVDSRNTLQAIIYEIIGLKSEKFVDFGKDFYSEYTHGN